jgi:uncharacterized membrane protein
MTRTLATVTTLLALLGIALSIEHLLDSNHYNPGFAAHPQVIRAHVILGGLYLAAALPQFLSSVRARRPRLHRAMGRVGVGAGVVAGFTALLTTWLFPYHGPIAFFLVGPWALWFVACLARGLWLARQRSFLAHREWMIRAFAIGTSIATMRLLFVPALLLLGDFADEALARQLSLVSFLAAFALHAAVAETWIRTTRGRHASPPFTPARAALGLPQP